DPFRGLSGLGWRLNGWRRTAHQHDGKRNGQANAIIYESKHRHFFESLAGHLDSAGIAPPHRVDSFFCLTLPLAAKTYRLQKGSMDQLPRIRALSFIYSAGIAPPHRVDSFFLFNLAACG